MKPHNMEKMAVFKALREIVMFVTRVPQCVIADTPIEAPKGAYATIRVMDGVRPTAKGGTLNVANPDGTMTVYQVIPTIFECSVNFYRGEALSYAAALANCSRLPTVHGILYRSELGWVESDPVQNLTAIQMNRSEQRAQVTVRLVGEIILDDSVGTIEHVGMAVTDENRNELHAAAVDSNETNTGA